MNNKSLRKSLWCSTYHNRQHVSRLEASTFQSKEEVVVPQNISTSIDKNSFLRLLGLVTQESGEALRKKLQERKKRSCTSPHFLSVLLEAEKNDETEDELDKICWYDSPNENKVNDEMVADDKPMDCDTELVSDAFSDEEFYDGDQGDIDELHDDSCQICKKCDVETLLLCDTCPRAYHLQCLGLSIVPKGIWFCPSCEDKYEEGETIDSLSGDIAVKYDKCLTERRDLVGAACTLRATLIETRKRVEEKKMLVKLKSEREIASRKQIDSYLLLLNNIDDLFGL